MKDGLRILEQVNHIHEALPSAKVSVETNAPVCSKTNQFLFDNHIIITKL